jgi:hypothetical protein
MGGRHTAIFGIYPNGFQAERAVAHLIRAGFSNNSIAVLLADNDSRQRFAHEKHTKAPEGATAGAIVMGLIGTVLGLLAGAGAPLVFPGVQSLGMAGPLVGALAGFGAGCVFGGTIGAIVGACIPEFEAKRYDEWMRGGGVLLSAHCDNAEQIHSAEEVLKMSGAKDIAAKTEAGRPKWPPVFL